MLKCIISALLRQLFLISYVLQLTTVCSWHGKAQQRFAFRKDLLPSLLGALSVDILHLSVPSAIASDVESLFAESHALPCAARLQRLIRDIIKVQPCQTNPGQLWWAMPAPELPVEPEEAVTSWHFTSIFLPTQIRSSSPIAVVLPGHSLIDILHIEFHLKFCFMETPSRDTIHLFFHLMSV